MKQKEFFNSMAEKWDTICQHDTIKIRFILNLLNIKNDAKILDVGTGTGVLIPFLHSRIGDEGEILAIDVSTKMLEVARGKCNYANVKFIEGDILDFNLNSEYFDYIFCYSVFPHFSDKQLAINRMGKFLRNGGKIVICHSQSRDEINNLHRKASEAVCEDDLPDIKTIKSYFKNAGLDTTVEIDNREMFIVIGEK